MLLKISMQVKLQRLKAQFARCNRNLYNGGLFLLILPNRMKIIHKKYEANV
ncbi:MAG: hypothetical protein GQ569_06820 [Methylococcaceae bacterium]|nr:hypothetical protein [Methylococcaceae bacterium]